MTVPRDVREPTEQNPDHQNPTVAVKPFGEASSYNSERGVEVARGTVLERSEEKGCGGGGGE